MSSTWGWRRPEASLCVRGAGLRRGPPRAAQPPQSTETVPIPAACSLRATERAVHRGISRGFRTGRPRRPMGTVTRVSGKALLEPKLVRRGAPAVLWREGRWGTRALGSAGRVGGQPGLQVARLCEIEQVFRQQLQLVQGEG